MSTRGSAAYLWDAQTALQDIREAVAGRTSGDYLADKNLRKIVERDLITLGEALAQVRRLDPPLAARLPSLPRAVEFRNVVVHSYAQLKQDVVWRTVRESLPVLEAEIEVVLRQLGDP